MNKWIIFFLITCIALISCAKKPEPTPPPPPPPVVQPEPEPEPEPQGPTAAELLAQRVQELLNQLLGNKIYFDFDKSEIRPEGKEILSEVGRIMMDGEAGQSISVRIEGHTCELGTEEYNMGLGERRARMVMQYLEGYGVGGSRLSIISFGEEQPAIGGSDESSLSQNRRAEFKATASIN